MQTIDSLIRESCRKYSDRPALRYKLGGVWQHMTYGALWELSERIAAGMIKLGFNVGNHAALVAPSSPQWVVAYLGILKAGGVVVPIDKELKAAELQVSFCESLKKVGENLAEVKPTFWRFRLCTG